MKPILPGADNCSGGKNSNPRNGGNFPAQFIVPDVFVANGFYGFNVYAQLFHIFIRDRTTAV